MPQTPPTSQQPAPHRAGLVLALGLVGLGVWILGPVAWALGKADLEDMHDGHVDPSGRLLTRVGMILGILGTLAMVLALLTAIGAAGAFVFFGVDSEGVIPEPQ